MTARGSADRRRQSRSSRRALDHVTGDLADFKGMIEADEGKKIMRWRRRNCRAPACVARRSQWIPVSARKGVTVSVSKEEVEGPGAVKRWTNSTGLGPKSPV